MDKSLQDRVPAVSFLIPLYYQQKYLWLPDMCRSAFEWLLWLLSFSVTVRRTSPIRFARASISATGIVVISFALFLSTISTRICSVRFLRA